VAFALVLSLAIGGLGPRTAIGADASSHPEYEQARQILDAAGIHGGLVVHLGCGDGKLTAALRADDSYLVHGLDADPKNVEKARQYIRSLKIYGTVSVDQLRDNLLPYIDNLVNLVVSESLGTVSMPEVMRVLCPKGVAYIKNGDAWTKTVKQWPQEMDEWTHYLHGPDGNPVASDSLVGPPAAMPSTAPSCGNVTLASGTRINTL